MLFRIALAASLILSVAGTSRADDIAAAKMHYEKGTTLFDLQRYLEAAKEYEAAFESKPDPALLFNIAQAYRFGGEYSKAIAAYRSYLRRVPDAENRGEIDLKIAELQKLSDEQKRNQQTPPAGTLKPGEKAAASSPSATESSNAATPTVVPPTESHPRAEKPSRSKLLIVGLSVTAVGVVALGVGAAFEGLAASTNDSLSHPAPGAVFDPSKERTLKNDETAGAVLLGVGAVAAVTGAVVAIVSARRRSVSTAIAPSVTSKCVGAVFHATF